MAVTMLRRLLTSARRSRPIVASLAQVAGLVLLVAAAASFSRTAGLVAGGLALIVVGFGIGSRP
jgi:hypothetical protein